VIRQGLWRLAAGAVDRLPGTGADRLSILIYHGVGERPAPLDHCDVDRARFEHHLQVLRQAFTVLPLGEAVRRLRAGTLPARAAAITFDDGYANNVSVALPLLRRHRLCATFFVATAYLDGGRMFNDAVIEAIRRCTRPSVDLQALGLGTVELNDVSARVRASERAIARLKYLPPDEREEGTAMLVEAAGVVLGPSLMMTSEDVRALAEAGMEIGAHTHRHPILASIPDQEARREIDLGRERLEAITGRPVTLFAYPNGRPGADYHARHVAMVREAGFEAAVSTARGCAAAGHDPYQLPRFTPWDRTPERFLCRLAWSRRGPAAAVAA